MRRASTIAIDILAYGYILVAIILSAFLNS